MLVRSLPLRTKKRLAGNVADICALWGKSAGLVTEWLRVRIPAGAARDFFFSRVNFVC